MENKCLICLNEKSVFLAAKKSYQHHIDVEHDIWLYPLYIKYLIEKDNEDFNGDEIYVWECYLDGQSDWMPLTETRYLT
jgi:hypothetical protein